VWLRRGFIYALCAIQSTVSTHTCHCAPLRAFRGSRSLLRIGIACPQILYPAQLAPHSSLTPALLLLILMYSMPKAAAYPHPHRPRGNCCSPSNLQGAGHMDHPGTGKTRRRDADPYSAGNPCTPLDVCCSRNNAHTCKTSGTDLPHLRRWHCAVWASALVCRLGSPRLYHRHLRWDLWSPQRSGAVLAGEHASRKAATISIR
jgi:hypothetical protein